MYKLRDRLLWLYYRLFPSHSLLNVCKLLPGTIPVIVNNFNRLTPLRKLVEWLSDLTVPTSIIILDNHSSYPPLLAYYDSLDLPHVQVVRLEKNFELGMILPVSVLLRAFEKYVVTDADLEPYDDTPRDILERMMVALDRYPYLNHVGASLEIEDIPPYYPLYEAVKKWEGQYWRFRAEAEGYKACVDTTFAMYRRSSAVYKVYPAMRLNRPYRLRHVDWYIHPDHMPEEYRYYLAHCTSVSTWNTKYKHEQSTGY